MGVENGPCRREVGPFAGVRRDIYVGEMAVIDAPLAPIRQLRHVWGNQLFNGKENP